MNERIRELQHQCWVKVPCDFDMRKGGLSTINTVFDYEKFAELIVQSILNSLETEREYYANPGTYQPLEYYVKMSAKEDALSDAISMIRSDFGVEE